eukprot:363309-Chlamydomonas_euryale.AAC.33
MNESRWMFRIGALAWKISSLRAINRLSALPLSASSPICLTALPDFPSHTHAGEPAVPAADAVPCTQTMNDLWYGHRAPSVLRL